MTTQNIFKWPQNQINSSSVQFLCSYSLFFQFKDAVSCFLCFLIIHEENPFKMPSASGHTLFARLLLSLTPHFLKLKARSFRLGWCVAISDILKYKQSLRKVNIQIYVKKTEVLIIRKTQTLNVNIKKHRTDQH